MALLLLARVAADHGGELEAHSDPSLDVTVRWPQFRNAIPNAMKRAVPARQSRASLFRPSIDSHRVHRIRCDSSHHTRGVAQPG